MRHFLEQCLHSLHAALQGIEAEVWVVDNASSDDSVPRLQPDFGWVHWLKSDVNLGFSRANNLALGKVTGHWVLFLNPDTLLPEDCLHQCLQFMAGIPNAGALGIRMVDGGGHYLPESKRGNPGPLTSFCKLTGLSALFPVSKVFARYYLGHLPPLQNHPVEVLSGAFMLVRKQVLDITGGFDERYFMYGEDIDLSYQINQTPIAGGPDRWQTWYFAGSSIIHFKGESTQKNSLRYLHTFYKAMRQFVKKHYAAPRAVIFSLFIYLAMAFRALTSLFAANRDITSPIGPVWVAGSPEDIEEVRAILCHTNLKGESINRLAPPQENTATCKSLAQWYAEQAANSGGTLIFCISPLLPFSQVMTYLNPEKKLRCLFHYRGSKSIVGSSDSNRRGDVISGG